MQEKMPIQENISIPENMPQCFLTVSLNRTEADNRTRSDLFSEEPFAVSGNGKKAAIRNCHVCMQEAGKDAGREVLHFRIQQWQATGIRQKAGAGA